MSIKLLLKPCNEQFLPISSPTTTSVDSFKSSLKSPQKKSKVIIDLNSEFSLDYLPPICLSPHTSLYSAPSHFHGNSLQSQAQIQPPSESMLRIINIKHFISAQVNIKPETLSLYMFNPSSLSKFQLLHDFEEFVACNPSELKSSPIRKRKYSASTSEESKQRVLYYKISKEKQKVVIDIFQNQIEKLILTVAYNCSIYMLKHLINSKLSSSIPLAHLTIYGIGFVDTTTHLRKKQALNKALSNKVFSDEVLIGEIVHYYSPEESRPRREVDRESKGTSMLNLILVKKTKSKCVMGLDFRFNYMRNFIKLPFDTNAPSYRETSDGLNLIIYCLNPNCAIADDYYIVEKGYGHFDIMEEITAIKCPRCFSVKKDLKNIGFIKSKWKYKGLLKNKKDAIIEGDGLTLDNMLYVFQEVLFSNHFQYLIIETEAYVVYNSNEGSHFSDENDSSSDLNDISLCCPQEAKQDDDANKGRDSFLLALNQQNSKIIIKSDLPSPNLNSECEEIIIEGKNRNDCYGCSIFSNENKKSPPHRSCSCLIV